MKREESLLIVSMIVDHWRVKDWTKEEMDTYAKRIEDLDAEVLTSTVIRASKEMTFAPRINELRERYKSEKRRLAPTVDPKGDAAPQPLPQWVKRWVCARLLYSRWGKERDLRRFPEQGEFGDESVEQMPEGAWEEEASSIPEEQFSTLFKQATVIQ